MSWVHKAVQFALLSDKRLLHTPFKYLRYNACKENWNDDTLLYRTFIRIFGDHLLNIRGRIYTLLVAKGLNGHAVEYVIECRGKQSKKSGLSRYAVSGKRKRYTIYEYHSHGCPSRCTSCLRSTEIQGDYVETSATGAALSALRIFYNLILYTSHHPSSWHLFSACRAAYRVSIQIISNETAGFRQNIYFSPTVAILCFTRAR